MVDGAGRAVLAVAVGVAAAAAGITALRKRFVVVTVRGPSMEPVLREGDQVLVRRRRMAQLRSGDLVVFAEVDPGPHPSDGWLIKRAVAVPGDPVPRDAGPALATVDDDVVPPDRLVAIGDNAAFSYDSRHYGYVSADRLLGVVLRRI